MGTLVRRRRQLLQRGLALAGLALLGACRQPVPPAAAPRSPAVPAATPALTRGPARLPIVGLLWPSAEGELSAAFRDGLRAHGHAEGRTVEIAFRSTEGADDRYPVLAQELVRAGTDVFVSLTMLGAQALQRVAPTRPIVLASSSHLVEAGLVTSLDRPGGNITGVMTPTGLSGRYPQVLKEALPAVSRLGAIWKPDDSMATLRFAEAQAAATALGLALLSLEVRDPADLGVAFDTGRAGRIESLIVFPHTLTALAAPRIVDRAARDRLPGLYPWREFALAGGLLAYGPSLEGMCRRAAGFVDRILRGAKPADLPVEQATDVEFLVNLRAARTLGLTIPAPVLQQATETLQ